MPTEHPSGIHVLAMHAAGQAVTGLRNLGNLQQRAGWLRAVSSMTDKD